MKYIASIAACLALAAPVTVYAQSDVPEEDGVLDLDSVDALLGDQVVTGDEDEDSDAAEEDAAVADGNETSDEEVNEDEASSDNEDAPELSDLTLAFNAYSLCASEAGAALEESGFAVDVIGQEALLRCSGQRAAYVNAFYFSLVPHYPDASEADVRASAERLVAQSDRAIANVVTREVTDLREIRDLDAAVEAENEDAMAAGSFDEGDAVDDEETPDGDNAEDEMEPDA